MAKRDDLRQSFLTDVPTATPETDGWVDVRPKIKYFRAVRVTFKNVEDLSDQIVGAYLQYDGDAPSVVVPTFFGSTHARLGDWILTAEDQLFVCTPSAFDVAYEIDDDGAS